MTKILPTVIWTLLGGAALAADLDRPPIRYTTAPDRNAVTDFLGRLKREKATLRHDADFGYLKALLKELNVPVSSQTLVFSRTSLQRSRIGPKTPRAIYFNDDVTVGFCRHGDVLELAASDPNLGTVFYTMDQDPKKRGKIERQTENCLICHGSSSTQGFPGHLIRSVSPGRSGDPVLSLGTKRVDHSTPFADRWGGWFVTGTSGKQDHMGNQMVGGWPGLDEKAPNANVIDLKPYFTVANYLTPHSDLVALMVLEHQGEAQNRISRANFLTRLALHEQDELNAALKEPADTRSEGITRRIHWACEPLVQYLLFHEEAPLTEPVAGTSDFAKEFAARAVRFQEAIAARIRPESEDVPLPDELHDLFEALRRPAFRGEGPRLPAALGSAFREGSIEGVRPPREGRPPGDPRDPLRDEARPAGVLEEVGRLRPQFVRWRPLRCR